MKSKSTILTAALALLAFLAIPMGMMGQTKAEVVSYTLEPIAGSNNSYAGNCDITIDDITWNLTGNAQMIPWRIGGKSISEVDRTLYSKTAISDDITEIEVTHGTASNITINSWTVIVASDADFNNVVSTLTPTFTAEATTTINRPEGADWSGCYYKFVYNVTVSGNSNRFIEFSQAKFYKEESTVTAPSITITPDILNLDASMHLGEFLTLTYENMEITGAGIDNFTAEYYNASGEVIDSPTWLFVGVAEANNGYQVIILIEANDGETRSAYFKLYTFDAENNKVYSNLVTVNQAAPMVDYATLPFVWEGGSSAYFLALNGVTSSGLGSDYAANNAPYLIKFDGTGDYIQVKTDSQPGKVTIGVKMIGGGNTSTITVQGSADGETFTDIEVLTISGAQNDTLTLETTNVFAENDRYVRMLFTKGSNVGVGPITIEKGLTPSISVTPATLYLDAAGQLPNGMQMLTLDVAYHNMEIEGASDFAVQYYDAQGEEQEEPEWIPTISVSGPFDDGVYRAMVIIMQNDGPARSAYFKIYALDADENVIYSNLVTINQASASTVSYTVTFNENGQDAQTLEITGGEIGDNLPITAFGSVPANSKFVGWSLTPVTNYATGNYYVTTAPEMVDATYYLHSDVTFYAVYATVRTEDYGEKGWAKATSADEFLAGNHYLIVSESHGKAAGEIENNVMMPYDVTIEDGVIRELPEGAFVLALARTGIDGAFALLYYTREASDMVGMYLVATAAKKLAWISPADIADYDVYQYSWFINIDEDGNATIQNGVESYGRFLYNVSSPRFTTYTSNPTSAMILPQLYIERGVYTEYNDYYFSQITEVSQSVNISDNEVWPYNYMITDAVVNVEEGGLLSVEGLLFNTDPNHLVIKDGGQLKNTNTVRGGTIQKNIVSYETYTGEGNGGYYLIRVPLRMSKAKAVNSGMIGDFPDFGDVDVYHFVQADEYEWHNLKTAETDQAVYGFFESNIREPLLYANKNNVLLTFATEAEDKLDGFIPTTTDDFYTAVNQPGAVDFKGWNLVGNPYACNAYLRSGRDFYRMNTAGDAIVLANEQNGGNVIKPCEAVFVVVAEENDPEQTFNLFGLVMADIYFTTTEPASNGSNSLMNVKVSRNNEMLDVARVRFNNGSMIGKMVLNEYSTRLSIAQGSNEYSVVRSEGQGEMPVNFKAGENGTYTISIDVENVDVNYLHLIDNMTGADIDLLATPSYSFEARTNDYKSRFRLVFNANDGTSTDSETFAFFIGNNLVINNEGEATLQVIDMMGRVLSSEQICGNYSNSLNLSAGVYVLRLSNGNTVKTQKIVID